MIKEFFKNNQITNVLCLLVMVGILSIGLSFVSYATDSNLTGATERQTNINDPGSSKTADDLKELNIANNLTVTYNDGNGEVAGSLRILMTLTAIAIAPMLIICVTSFTRILIVLHFTRTALNTQTAPPNQVLIGLTLFLTFFIMSPVISQINDTAIKPFDAGEITQEEAFEAGMEPLRQFMYEQTKSKDASMFMQIAEKEWDGTLEQIPNTVLIPSFIVSELRTAFIIGFLIYIPFIIIDMVVASTLMSMGMMMLPPTTISMPFKILLFVLADGWNLIIINLVKTFY
ncbi:MAG TPA: flagellar type III secretion system pore protein FliP [Lachnospiraceae bacterium]|nr:flagellar type III secretion system pore protein FliP [Lachnospiraceae bacterium]